MNEEQRKLQNDTRVVVAGAGGFIGGHLVAQFRNQGYKQIRAVDEKPLDEWYQRFDDVENLSLNLNLKENCEVSAKGAHEIYNLAANMGGMGFIEHNKALCMLSVLINTHMLQAALNHGCQKFFYSSSACVYNADKSARVSLSPNTAAACGCSQTPLNPVGLQNVNPRIRNQGSRPPASSATAESTEAPSSNTYRGAANFSFRPHAVLRQSYFPR